MVEPVQPSLADTLRRLRKAHGFSSQARLAEAAGLSPSTIGNVEAGTRNLGRESCEAVAAVLGLNASEVAELMTAAGHAGSAGAVATFDGRLTALERRQTQQEGTLRELLEALELLRQQLAPRARGRR